MLGSDGSSASGLDQPGRLLATAQVLFGLGLRGAGGRNPAEELAGRKGIGAIGRTERLILDLSYIGVPGAVLALQIEVFANRVVEYAHGARSDPPSKGQA